MIYFIVGIVIVALMILFRWWGKKPVKYRINLGQGDFQNYLETLLHRGYDRGFMIIEAPDRKRFIQFSKYIKDRKCVGLQFDFPCGPWSAEYFEPLKSLLNRRNYEYEIQKVNPSPKLKLSDQVSEFIVVDLKQDLDSASELSRLVLLEIFRIDATDTAIIWFMGISLWDERIGF